MVQLDKNQCHQVYNLYKKELFFFPLIAAVIQGRQEGAVFVDDPLYPTQVYVEHHFGFSQVFGKRKECFEKALKSYLIGGALFGSEKVRMYGVGAPEFLQEVDPRISVSWRQRASMNVINSPTMPSDERTAMIKGVKTRKAIESDLTLLQKQFDVVERFWNTSDDFISKSNAIVSIVDEMPVSICYAAAEAENHVEIDIFTLPEYRKQGVGRQTVLKFVEHCQRINLKPLWDCYTNNKGSVALRDSLGFSLLSDPYPFYTICKVTT